MSTGRYSAVFLPVLQGVQELGGNRILAQCPFHNDEDPSFSVDLDKGLWICFGCDARGNEKSFRRRLDLGDVYVPPPTLHALRTAISKLIRGDSWTPATREELTNLYPGYDVWADERGFAQRTVRKWGLGYDPMADHLLIPVWRSNGEPVGLIHRDLDPDAKARYLNTTGMPKSEVLFGANLLDSTWCCITEGPLDAVALDDAGIPAVALMGNRMSERQGTILRQTGVEIVVVALDGDQRGQEAADILVGHTALRGLRVARITSWGRHSKDPGETTRLGRRRVVHNALPADLKDLVPVQHPAGTGRTTQSRGVEGA